MIKEGFISAQFDSYRQTMQAICDMYVILGMDRLNQLCLDVAESETC